MGLVYFTALCAACADPVFPPDVASRASALLASPVWYDRAPAAKPPFRYRTAMAYDATRREVLLFGGDYGSGALRGDTWIWNGTTWANRTPSSGGPAARRDHTMAYDRARGEVVLFGGWDGQNSLADTWVWNGTTWSARSPAAKPPARSATGMVYDEARAHVVVFGGWSGTAYLNDTWVWNGTTWAQKTTTTKPAARMAHALAFDALRSVVVLFGGATPTILGDTWAWNGTTWAQRAPARSPSARAWAGMDYDSMRIEIQLVAGLSGQTIVGDVWAWDGTTWADRTPTQGALPAARNAHSVAYDRSRSELVLFGGSDGLRYRDDTWVFRSPECTVNTDCVDSLVCTTDTCVGGTCVHDVAPTSCGIGGACYAPGVTNPTKPCESCDPATSRTTWSPRLPGVICAGGTCNGAGSCSPRPDAGADAGVDSGAFVEPEPIVDAGENETWIDAGSLLVSPATAARQSERAVPHIATDTAGCTMLPAARVHSLAPTVFLAAALCIARSRRNRRSG